MSNDSVLDQLEGTPADTNTTITCPKCGHKSASAIRWAQGGYAWQCFRASCGARGGKRAGRPTPGKAPRAFVARPYPYHLVEHAEIPGALWAPVVGETVFPCYGLDSALLGHVSRKETAAGKQVRNWRLRDSAFYSYHRGALATRLWIVEDWRSASRLAALSPTAHAIALLGVTLGDAMLQELVIHFNKTQAITVALDPGAEGAAVKVRNKLWVAGFRDTNIAIIDRDIKDMPPSEVHALCQTQNRRILEK